MCTHFERPSEYYPHTHTRAQICHRSLDDLKEKKNHSRKITKHTLLVPACIIRVYFEYYLRRGIQTQWASGTAGFSGSLNNNALHPLLLRYRKILRICLRKNNLARSTVENFKSLNVLLIESLYKKLGIYSIIKK